MSTPNQKAFVLRTLRLREGNPATEELLLLALAGAFPGDLTRSEAGALLNNMEAEDLVAGATHAVLQSKTFTLTTKGQHAANQMR
jgi:hypothetical protein